MGGVDEVAGYVDDASAGLTSHLRQHGLAGVVRAFETAFELRRVIGPSDRAEGFAVARIERVMRERVVDENVETAERGDRGGHHAAHLLGVGDIRLACDHATGRIAIVHDPLRALPGTLVVADIIDDHARSRTRQTACDRRSDATACASDHRHTSGKRRVFRLLHNEDFLSIRKNVS